MEYIPLVPLILIIRFGVPALMTWYFEKYVEPKAVAARQADAARAPLPPELTNAEKIQKARKDIENLRQKVQRPGA